ncbi:MAG: hypothetical protein NTU44_11280 [Bacteroidetes bacterium]|nr:hypothetical protein [Bacteroidota bacterium]
MKKLVLTIVAIIGLYGLSFAQNITVSGTLNYDNPQLTLIRDSATVSLYQGTTLAYSVTIHSNGSYLFENVAAGSYSLKASCSKKWWGGNALDALLMQLHFVGMQYLTGLKLTVADVNGSGGIPGSADALAVARRFARMIPNFMPPNVPPPGNPDWISQSIPVTVEDGMNYNQNIKILCTGDVNGSYIPN